MNLPTQQQLLMPLLEAIAEHGGELRCTDACGIVAERIGLPAEAREAARTYRLSDGREKGYNLFDRRLRWTRQNAVQAGFLHTPSRGIWALSERGEATLTRAQPGVVVAVAVSDAGTVLWADAISAMSLIEEQSIQLALTSPPYPLIRQRDYGGWSPDVYVETLLRHLDRLKPLLTLDGSVALNLGDVYTEGAPFLQTYQEQIAVEMTKRGWNLAGRTMWVSPAKPKTTPWVTKRSAREPNWSRCRLANGYEIIWHWAPTSRPFLSNLNVLEPYSERFQQTLAAGGEVRGQAKGGSRMSSPGVRYRNDNGGRIPFNVITASNSNLGRDYTQFCKEQNLPLHPATMPTKVAEFLVKFGSRAGDVVFDPFGGSLTTAVACENTGRRYIASDMHLEYLRGGLFKLRNAPGLACELALDAPAQLLRAG